MCTYLKGTFRCDYKLQLLVLLIKNSTFFYLSFFFYFNLHCVYTGLLKQYGWIIYRLIFETFFKAVVILSRLILFFSIKDFQFRSDNW